MAGNLGTMRAFSAQMNCLYEILAFIREETEKFGFQLSTIPKIELACEEAIVNIIKYGFPGKEKEENLIEIEMSSYLLKGIKIQICDQGIPYNPFVKPITTPLPIINPIIGGYGRFLIKNLMDEVDYRRDREKNTLSLIKFFSEN